MYCFEFCTAERDTREKRSGMRAFPASGANLPESPPIEIIRDTKTN